MSKKLYEIASELKVESKEIILRMGEVGISLASHLAPVDKDLEERIKEVFKKQRVGDVETVEITTTVKRRRMVKEQPAPEPAVQQVKKTETEPAGSHVEPAAGEKEKAGYAAEEAVKSQIAEQAKDKGVVQAASKAVEVRAQEIEEFPVQKQLVIIEQRKEAKGEEKREEKKKEGAAEDKDREKRLLRGEEKIEKKTKGRRLIYDRRRDFISLRDFDEIVELELPVIAKKRKTVKGKKSQSQVATVVKPSKRIIKMTSDAIQVGELAHIMGVKSNELVKKLMDMGVMVTVVNSIDFDTACLVAQEFGYTVEKVAFNIADYIKDIPDSPDKLVARSPVVTIMGHVDHGKTTLLDRIRETRVAEGEAGGITQHIGAYRVRLSRGEITFLDTPGHEAFTAMRARGAKVTDIVVLVVAADDGVKAQTVEAINHAREAEVPIIVAINKIDRPEANVEKVKKELMDYNLIPEEWGGSTIFAEISAKHNIGIENLLEMILLQAEMLELKANPFKPAKGIVLESRLDRGKGAVATVIVQEGTLRRGDIILSGKSHGRVRLLIDDTGKNMREVKPSQPALVVGWDTLPRASELFVVLDDEKKVKSIIEHLKLQEHKEKAAQAVQRVSLEDLFRQVQMGVVKDLKLVLKTDVQGSLEALEQSISKLTHPEIKVKIIHSGIGNITESDVNLALASGAIIMGFQVNIEPSVREMADREKVDVKLYSVIYELVDDIRKAMEGLLVPKIEEKLIGKVEIRQVFNISKLGKVAGCFVQSGRVTRSANVKLLRNGEKVFEGKLNSLKRFKDDVKEVKQGFECGMSFEDFVDFEVGDIVEIYEASEVQQKLTI